VCVAPSLTPHPLPCVTAGLESALASYFDENELDGDGDSMGSWDEEGENLLSKSWRDCSMDGPPGERWAGISLHPRASSHHPHAPLSSPAFAHAVHGQSVSPAHGTSPHAAHRIVSPGAAAGAAARLRVSPTRPGAAAVTRSPIVRTSGFLVNVNVNELRLGFSNATRNLEGILSHNNRKS
jgi:hypothetical protein